MSISELLPAVRSLPDSDKLQLIRILAEDLAGSQASLPTQLAGDFPVWTPHNAFEAADTLLAALHADEHPNAHA